jgi:outer membrane protein
MTVPWRINPASARRAAEALALLVTSAIASQAAHADPVLQVGNIFVRGGFAYAAFDTDASVSAAGRPVPGANVRVTNNAAFMAELGYYVLPFLSVSASAGYPPTTKLVGEGTLAPLGVLGRVTYGTTAIALQYHAPPLWRFRPYIGGGVDYTYIFNNDDGAMKHLRVDNSVGPVLQAGVDFRIDRHVSLFGDVKKIWLKTDANASFPTQIGAIPSHTRITLNPLVLNIGVSYRF